LPIKFSKNSLYSIILLSVSVVIALVLGEGILHVKNSSMTNYDIEMWRYARELKARSPDPALDFEHLKNRSAVLQNIDVRLNEWGLRGGAVEPAGPDVRRILFLGGSTTLGWGVPEEATVEKQLEKMLTATGMHAQVLNAGVGNYNAERYVSRFFKQLTGLNPTDIVVQYFMRDAENLASSRGNILLRNSELAVTLWIAYQRRLDALSAANLVEHYRKLYDPQQPGFMTMERELKKLGQYSREHGIRLYFMMIPDVHDLVDYKFAFVHDIMRDFAQQNGYAYIDLLPPMSGLRPQEIWAMPGDPHPNALGHKLMADAIFPVIMHAPVPGSVEK
jgi:lysophospholipase L1-like esterase